MSRPSGSQNKAKLIVAQYCLDKGCSPLDALIELMKQPEYKFLAAKELMPYIYPKLKHLEFTLSDVPDEVFDQEIERRIHLKILQGGGTNVG